MAKGRPTVESFRTTRIRPRVGKFTHPSGAPDNHLLTIYSPGPVNHQYKYLPQLDGGIYLIKDGQTINEPAQMLLIKNDPQYNESWPRAVVPYERIYGVNEPETIAPARQRWKAFARTCLPARRLDSSARRACTSARAIPTASCLPAKSRPPMPARNDPWKGLDAFTSHGNGMPVNWHNQGADAGLYDNDDIHAVRILAMEPTTDRTRGRASGRRYYNHANERLRILGEIPVRKFGKAKATARSRWQSRHQLPGQDSGRCRLHVSNDRQARHGVEHGANVASVAARRNSPRLRRLPRP